MTRQPDPWIELARLSLEDAVPGEVLPAHGPLRDQDRMLFRDWECAAAPRGVHKSLVSGMAIQMHEGAPVLAFTGQVCHRTADRELLLKDRCLRDGRISALVLPQDATCGPTTDCADCAEALVGIVFRLATVRQYYQFGIEGLRRLVLYRRNHDEWAVLAEHPLPAVTGWLDLTVCLRGDAIHCVSQAAGADFTVTDTLFHSGRVGVRALRRALLKSLEVAQTASAAERERASGRRTSDALHRIGGRLPDAIPVASLPFSAAGRTPKFGDFAVPGRHDVLLPHEDRLSAVSADGSTLWEFPEPATDLVLSADHLAEHGRLIVAMGGPVVEAKMIINGRPAWTNAKATELLVIAGRTGKLLARAPLPVSPSPQSHFIELMKSTARLSGAAATDIVVRDNRSDLPSGGGATVWAYDRFLRPLWEVTQEQDMAHYGHAHALAPFDVDGDGRDEILAGGILYGADGRVRWRHDRGRDVAHWPNSGDHYDNVVIGSFAGDATLDPVAGLAASSAGFYLVDGLTGETIAWHRIGHAQFVIAAKLRADLAGAQFVVANHHGSNGVLSLFSGRGEHLWSSQPTFHVVEEPVAVAWPGAEADLLWVHTLDSRQAFYDGFGRCVKRFPQIEALIGEWPHRDLNAQAVRFGNGAQQMMAFTAHDRLHVFGPEEKHDERMPPRGHRNE